MKLKIYQNLRKRSVDFKTQDSKLIKINHTKVRFPTTAKRERSKSISEMISLFFG